MADPAKLGGKLGPRLARQLADAATHHLKQSADVRSRIELNAKLGVFRTMTAEARGTTSHMFRALIDRDGQPLYLHRTLDFLAHGSGELQAVISALATAQSLTPGVGQLISNDLGPKIQNLIAENPHSLVGPDTAARAVATRLWDDSHGNLEAARGGLSSNRFETLVELARSYPDIGSALELLRRGEATRDQVAFWLNRQGFDGATVNTLLHLERQHLAPADAAEMVLRGILSEQSGRDVARIAGLASSDFDAMVLNTGEPPAIEELLFLYRRGKIDRQRLDHGIRQSRVRNEWIDAVENLQHRPMDTGSAVMAVVQGHLSDQAGQKIAEENGLEPAHWRPLVETHGRPPGTQEMLALLNRGEASQSEVEQAIRESDVKDKYIPALLKIRRHLMPERTIVSAISKGVFTEREGITHLLNLGFNAADAKALASEASSTKTAHHKTLAEGTIVRLYEAHTFSREQAHKAIVALGYTAGEVDWILAFADLRRVDAERQHLLGVLRTRYVAHHIDANQVMAEAGALEIPNAELERLLRMWAVERGANARQLTEPQTIKAMKKGLITQDDAGGRLVAMGYSQADAELLIAMA